MFMKVKLEVVSHWTQFLLLMENEENKTTESSISITPSKNKVEEVVEPTEEQTEGTPLFPNF
jgi:hypothetical protein